MNPTTPTSTIASAFRVPELDEQLCRTETALRMMALFTMRFLEDRGLSSIEWIRAAGESAAAQWAASPRSATV